MSIQRFGVRKGKKALQLFNLFFGFPQSPIKRNPVFRDEPGDEEVNTSLVIKDNQFPKKKKPEVGKLGAPLFSKGDPVKLPGEFVAKIADRPAREKIARKIRRRLHGKQKLPKFLKQIGILSDSLNFPFQTKLVCLKQNSLGGMEAKVGISLRRRAVFEAVEKKAVRAGSASPFVKLPRIQTTPEFSDERSGKPGSVKGTDFFDGDSGE